MPAGMAPHRCQWVEPAAPLTLPMFEAFSFYHTSVDKQVPDICARGSYCGDRNTCVEVMTPKAAALQSLRLLLPAKFWRHLRIRMRASFCKEVCIQGDGKPVKRQAIDMLLTHAFL